MVAQIDKRYGTGEPRGLRLYVTPKGLISGDELELLVATDRLGVVANEYAFSRRVWITASSRIEPTEV